MAKKVKAGSSAKAARRRDRKKRSAIQARRKKEFTYRGLTLSELQALSSNEVIQILPSRARRSLTRGYNEEQQRFIDRLRAGKKPVLKTHVRYMIILPEYVGKRISIYNGREYNEVEIQPEMIGHYLGEFAMTRKTVKHSGPGVGATRSSKFMPLK